MKGERISSCGNVPISAHSTYELQETVVFCEPAMVRYGPPVRDSSLRGYQNRQQPSGLAIQSEPLGSFSLSSPNHRRAALNRKVFAMIYSMKLIRYFFADKNGKMVLAQKPNVPLLAWAVLLLLSKLLPPGGWQSWAGYISTASLVIWAVLEVGWGVTPFRRTLGTVVLGIVALRVF